MTQHTRRERERELVPATGVIWTRPDDVTMGVAIAMLTIFVPAVATVHEATCADVAAATGAGVTSPLLAKCYTRKDHSRVLDIACQLLMVATVSTRCV